MKVPKIKGWIAIAHTRIGAEWCFTWAAWSSKPTARPWRTPLALGRVLQLDGEVVVVDAQEQALAAAQAALPGCAAPMRVEDGFALAARREAAGDEPRYRPIAAPGLAAEAYYAVFELSDEPPPKIAIMGTRAREKGMLHDSSLIEHAERIVGARSFWAAWWTCGKPTLDPWTPPDDLGIVVGVGSLEQAIGAADEACRRGRGDRVNAFSLGRAFAARSYTDGARCTSTGMIDRVRLGKEALFWLGLEHTSTESEVSRAWGKKVALEKLHPDHGGNLDQFKRVEAMKRAAIDYLAARARITGKITEFAQEKIDKAAARKKKTAEKKTKARAALGENDLV